MPQKPREVRPGQSARHFFGAEIRARRQAFGMSLEVLAHQLGYSRQQLSRIELGDRAVQPDLPARLDQVLRTGGTFQRLWKLVESEAHPDYARRFFKMEERATRIETYSSHAIHGLLQTEGYARAMMRAWAPEETDEAIQERLALRLERQKILTRPNAPVFWLILDEAVLRRPVGDASVMREQWARLVAAVGPRLTLQVLPFSAGAHGAMGGSMTVLTLPDGPDVAYMEGSHRGHLEETPATVARRRVTYDHLRALALPPAESVTLVRSLLRESYPSCLHTPT
ncbi:helix-turn-helix domain-containing protein [Allostreptomyces psammosilenae]|uniref:Transcriptional regulator with XRE-family HTH domain n=1 Tax=Allostreptomyces psammosilenae TaxID=1892865 RepID=A0A852ZWX8_9ACTN|nr:helix-turn-helix transcriptional regulator [Allostreptomyces psammosilenae]NYI06903.1 transcriptional regulator with XRE-family HTH domain [Allostreptomyces psammosilenae]